jgi:hypothetical protein
MGAGSHPMGPGAHDMAHGAHEMGAGSHPMGPGSRAMGWVARALGGVAGAFGGVAGVLGGVIDEMGPGSHRMRPRFHRMGPGSHASRSGLTYDCSFFWIKNPSRGYSPIGRREAPGDGRREALLPSQEAMSKHKQLMMRIALNLASLGINGRTALAKLVLKFAPQSAIYLSNPTIKDLADKVVAGGADVEAKQTDVDIKRKAYLSAVVARDTSDGQLCVDIVTYKDAARAVCKTPQDLEALALAHTPKPPQIQLTVPEGLTAKTGKAKGTFDGQCKRIAGLGKYICQVSADPITPTSWVDQPGTASKRVFSGFESGKGYWIRFCTERGQHRSGWSDPVYVIAR